jgi:hypothetical protein
MRANPPIGRRRLVPGHEGNARVARCRRRAATREKRVILDDALENDVAAPPTRARAQPGDRDALDDDDFGRDVLGQLPVK